ncbi:MAG: UpxY family transcription antiterminator [Bacteroidetes bacterium]|nr:UpxY family transcription antiterminator [Bacteroidota bacterium]
MTVTPKWYALYLRSRYEKKVYEALEKKEIEVFLPLIEKVHIWSDRKKKIKEPLFRGYIFVKTDLRDKEIILMTEGVVRFVGINQRPSWIPEIQIDWLRKIVRESADVQCESYIEIGNKVRITGGSLSGVEGIVDKVHGISRVIVSIAAIEQSISIQVPAELLEVIHS